MIRSWMSTRKHGAGAARHRPRGCFPGMPEWGVPRATHPQKALAAGCARYRTNLRCPNERHTLRHCGAARLSRGCRRRHPLALVHTGDMISLDVPARTLIMEVDDNELARRKTHWIKPQLPGKRGYSLLYRAHVTQAERGCDFDFLEGDDPLPEPDIY